MDLLRAGHASSDDENAPYKLCGTSNTHKEVLMDNEDSSVDQNDELSEYELQYGRTPPRTRILRRNRERKQRDQNNQLWTTPNPSAKRMLRRRNTVSNTFDDLISRADNTDSDQGSKRTNKRTLKLLRGSERDLKLDIASAQINAKSGNKDVPKTSHIVMQVEGVRRFMSLCSRRVCQSKANFVGFKKDDVLVPENEREPEYATECPQSRVDFHKTLALLVRMGCGEKPTHERSTRRHISREEYLWQNELKDLIWLELQAWHADRTPVEQDDYLCTSRGSVVNILDDIMTYKFNRHKQHLSAHSSDSGVEEDCQGCVSVICQSCMEAQNEGLRDVEKLMSRLEAAESLFPSSKAFGEFFPTYNTTEFVGRVKAMCLWYNMTRHQLLKIVILGRMLTLEDRYIGPSSLFLDPACSVESTSPSDSNSSTSSLNDFLSLNGNVILTSINNLITRDPKSTQSPFRGYIENMLKTRALSKSLNFLERLDKNLLRKAKLTLRKPENENIYDTVPTDNEDEELLRYGSWSPESKALALPSYKSIFVFLSCIPLEVIHEFLCMRLEQKPENPSPLSIRQLLRELKEGIRLATNYRHRVMDYVHSVLKKCEMQVCCKEKLTNFDKTLLEIVTLYLDYLEQWALLHHATFQKSLLEEEWNFCCDIVTLIPGGIEIAGMKFCSILNSMLDAIGERLLNRIDESAILLREYQDDVNKRQCLFTVSRELQQCFSEERERCIKTVAFTKNIFRTKQIPEEHIMELKKSVITFKCRIPNAIVKVQKICDVSTFKELDDTEKSSLTSRCREILLQGYCFGFDYYKVMSDLIPANRKERLARSMIQFSLLWMTFVRERCERGRGMRPRWAYQGLEFLLVVCDPQHTMHLTEEEFEDLKVKMDACISHVIGTSAPATPDSGFFSSSPRISLSRSRGSSPSPRATYRSQRSNTRKTSTERSPIIEQIDAIHLNLKKDDIVNDIIIKLQPPPQCERVREAVDNLDSVLDQKLHEQQLIGSVIARTKAPVSKAHIRRRFVTFTWQRGIKIGQGRFGKVYTAVNNHTGEMMAVKEIALQPNDKHAIQKVAEELKILEGILHPNLVKYYGLEVHREEMLLFMEFCSEGTLENLVAGTENGLPELLIRRYTFQLVNGVAELHTHGIVHRDIKTANIFLTDNGNCLKIGDFGCAIKIRSNTTMPGELQGFVGTQAYMAPEVFMKTSTEGHGRASDIWSVGCVVIEMASGKRPWAEYDSNYQIMFKVGMGEKPAAPDSLIDEGHDFLELCLQHNPRDRATAAALLDHNFVKIGDDFT